MPPTSKSQKRSRYGSLRPHAPKILEWCAEGAEWSLIRARLAADGVDVAMGTLWAHAMRHGWLLIHPYSQHYNDCIAYQFSRGELTVEDLRAKMKQQTNTHTQ